MRLEGAACLVTGASSGIGRAAAGLLAARGARLVLLGRDEARLRAAAGQLGAAAIELDLRELDGVAAAVTAAEAVHGRLDVLVCSAGVGLAGPVRDLDPAAAAEVAAVNLVAPMALARRVLPAMLDRGHGSIVLVGSIAGSVGVRGEAAYAASKAGLAAFAESLRQEVGRGGVAVSLVVPGVVDTPFFDRRGVPYARRFPRPVPAAKVAEAICRAIETGRPETYVPRWLALPPRVRALSPSLYRLLADHLG